MFKKSIALASLACLISAIGCQDASTISAPTDQGSTGTRFQINASDYSYLYNASNPWDSVGLRHNQAFGEFLTQISKVTNSSYELNVTTDSAERMFMPLIKNYYNQTHGVNITAVAPAGYDLWADAKVNLESLLASSSFSNGFENKLRQFIDTVYASTAADQIITIAQQYETQVIADTLYSTQEKNALLCVVSTAKFSAAFWSSDIFNAGIAEPMTKVAITRKQWGRCAAIDATGAYAGFLGGMFGTPAAMLGGAVLWGSASSVAYLLSLEG